MRSSRQEGELPASCDTNEYRYSADYNDPLLAELYDREETGHDDVNLLRSLFGGLGPLRILEPFSGTGRILIPLAADGHRVTGIEIAPAMSERAERKMDELEAEVRSRVKLRIADALTVDWGSDYDVVVIGGNALYELPAAEAQASCFTRAAAALRPGGYLYVDNNDYKGGWEDGPFNEPRTVLEGKGSNGALGRFETVSLGFDPSSHILQMERRWTSRSPKGEVTTRVYRSQKRPVSADDVRGWLADHGFLIHQVFGDRRGTLYTETSERAIFWAQKRPI